MGQIEGWDATAEALYALQSRACLVTKEVHLLLSAGLPMAALARARTLHETAVIAVVISKFGRDQRCADLAQRFLDHWIIDVVRDYKAAVESGLSVDLEELDHLTERRNIATLKYGLLFSKDYGWAACLFPNLDPKKGRVSFADLEKLAEARLSRLDYRLGSHQVHASSLALELHSYEQAGEKHRITGATNTGFAAPATAALDALIVATTALVNGATAASPDLTDILFQATLSSLANTAIAAFEEGEETVQRTMSEAEASSTRGERAASPTVGHIRRIRRWLKLRQ